MKLTSKTVIDKTVRCIIEQGTHLCLDNRREREIVINAILSGITDVLEGKYNSQSNYIKQATELLNERRL